MSDYRDEAARLVEIIIKCPDWPGASRFSAKDMRFVKELKQDPGKPVTQRMIFWLRDIRDRCDEDEPRKAEDDD